MELNGRRRERDVLDGLTELKARGREIERLKAQLAEVVKRTAATEGEQSTTVGTTA